MLLRVIANLITKTLKIAMLGWLNRLLGGVFGLLKGVVLMSIFVFAVGLVPFSATLLESIEVKASVLYPILEVFGPKFYEEIQKITAILI